MVVTFSARFVSRITCAQPAPAVMQDTIAARHSCKRISLVLGSKKYSVWTGRRAKHLAGQNNVVVDVLDIIAIV